MSKSDLFERLSAIISDAEIEALAALVAERLAEEALPKFLNENDAANLIGLTSRSLQAMRYDGTGPAFMKFGDSLRAPVRYCRSELIRWAQSHQRRCDRVGIGKTE